MASARETMALLKQVQARTGASLNECSKALNAANGDVHAALNALAERGHTGGRSRWDPSSASSGRAPT